MNTNKSDYIIIPVAFQFHVVKVEWYGAGRFKPLNTISHHFKRGQAVAAIWKLKSDERKANAV